MGMTVSFDTKNLNRALEKLGDGIRDELRASLAISLREIASEAKRTHRFTSRTSRLENSIRERVDSGGLSGQVAASAFYAPYIHNGTGRYGKGSGEYQISPKSRKALYFVVAGKKVFAKKARHPGIRPDPFLYRALAKKKAAAVERINKSIHDLIQRAGL
jgi:hypothetical protein